MLQSAGQSGGKVVGFDAIGVEGLISKLIFSHSGKAPSISELVMNNKVIAYCLPQGVICQMFRDIAAKKPCVITHTGLHTFIDPRVEGGKVNDVTRAVRSGETNRDRWKRIPSLQDDGHRLRHDTRNNFRRERKHLHGKGRSNP